MEEMNLGKQIAGALGVLEDIAAREEVRYALIRTFEDTVTAMHGYMKSLGSEARFLNAANDLEVYSRLLKEAVDYGVGLFKEKYNAMEKFELLGEKSEAVRDSIAADLAPFARLLGIQAFFRK